MLCYAMLCRYYHLSTLLAGDHFNSFVAPLGPGAASSLEGTPNIYGAALHQRGGLYMLDARIGFHFNDDEGVDQVGEHIIA